MSSKLRETINRVMWEDHDGGKARLYTTDELEAAIKAYILEIIGEEPQYRDGYYDFKTNEVISPSSIRNQLRAEQRKKLDD